MLSCSFQMLTHLLLVFFKVFFLTFLHLYNKGISRVVILFLILFNFQDAVSVALASSFNIISHSKPFVKYFFQVFFKSFFCVALSCETALILYHFLFFLSSTFSKFFQKVFRDQLRSLSRQLNYYITFSFLCQALFKKFFSARLCLPPGMGFAYSSSSFFSLQSKSNILLTLSRDSPRSTVMLLYTFSSSLSSKRMDKYIPVFCVF